MCIRDSVDEEFSNDYAVDAAGRQLARGGIAPGGVRPLGIRDLDDRKGDFTVLTGALDETSLA